MTQMTFLINYVDADVDYQTTPTNFIEVDMDNDYIIHTSDDNATVTDLMTSEPTPGELSEAAVIIDENVDTIVPLTLLMDASYNVGGAYYTHEIKGVGENKQYVYCFSFDGATATEPRFEAWDTDEKSTANNHVLGAGTANNSMVKAVCTTSGLPGVDWAGAPIAGANVLLLNDGNGALSELESAITSQELYMNMKIVLPAAYDTPYIETFLGVVRYTYVS
jgi:hypothetical protein